ncbi:DUF1682 domain protein [Aspergillus terreus]|uniref:DUF1682 domain protein n=1 Tax=Aspergillus terreus TaxID=33178 RepID=A0A5M3YT00_ASPTE|nr:hypothetical protein ATETN484_0003068100 [Aspergillus terreus]GFF14667.1 DUF1682 domain protein [Aspergillus terreus]
MAGIFKNVFGGSQPSGSANVEDDFADFVKAPEPSPASILAASSSSSTPAYNTQAIKPVPYTKWYRVWERTSPQDFLQEAMVMPLILLIVVFHLWGTRKNRRRAKEWAQAHAPVLQSEFALVGFDGVPKSGDNAITSELASPETILKEKSAQEYTAYATGRQNVAFVDVSIKMPKRYNPIIYYMDMILGFLFDSYESPSETCDAVAYTFDGKEKDVVPVPGGDTSSLKVNNSSYDGFIWAVVHKNHMRKFREERYDASMTFTKDNSKLPAWVTVMTESAEITDTLLSPELIQAIEKAGDHFKYLIITDQPVDKPTKLEETTPRKRVQVSTTLPSSSGYTATMPLFSQFLRLADKLVSVGHFRPEVLRKIRNTREEEIRKLRRADEEEKAEERKLAAEKLKKEERERLLRSMSAEEQRKFLEREAQKGQRRSMKKYTRRQ